MLFRNDRFKDQHEREYRVLHVDTPEDSVWVICLDDPHGWPERRNWSDIQNIVPLIASASTSARDATTSSHAQKLRAKTAMEAIAPLTAEIPAIFVPEQRARLLEKRANETGFCERTLRNYLREYWQKGQTESALLGKWHKCGVHSATLNQTAKRGRKPIYGDYTVFEVDQSSHAKFDDAAKWYLKDERHTIAAAYQYLLRSYYAAPDGNGELTINLMGDRPSARQFGYYLKRNYSIEERLRARKGDKEFDRDYRAKLGSSRFNCSGVGDIYEIDATIADIYLVAKEDSNKIIGKATLYIIIDRRSGLIVGFYIGLENASWSAARLAILSIVEDKAELCRKYGVAYHPEDWPAHGVMPQQFLADRGEMISKASNQIIEGLHTTVANVPGLRPDWKPFVECSFKLIHQSLAKDGLGYDPVPNAQRRRGKPYEKDACYTLHDFTKVVLEIIISHNRRPKQKTELSLAEINAEIIPAPIHLWNYGIQTRSGYLSRANEQNVRFALMPTGEASITEKGISFQGCFYTCEEAIQKGWFVQARRGRSTVTVSYDQRRVDSIYIHYKTSGGSYIRADMTDASRRKYAGLSFPEVENYEYQQKVGRHEHEQIRQQEDLVLHQKKQPTIVAAQGKLARAPKVSRSARKADTKEARQQSLREERAETSVPLPRKPSPAGLGALPSPQDDAPKVPVRSRVAELAAQARARMMNG